MTTDVKKRGIVDPWKVVAPLTPPPSKPAPTEAKKNLSEIDFDADIRPPRMCVFRGKHSSVEVKNNNVSADNDALRDLLKCLFEVLELEDGPDLFDEQHIGLRLAERSFEPPAQDTQTATLSTGPGYTPAGAVFFRNQDLDQGLLRLVRILRTVQKRPGIEGERILKHYGITPMLR